MTRAALTPAFDTPHLDLYSGMRRIRASGVTDAILTSKDAGDLSLYRGSSNLDGMALDVIRPIVVGENALIVTGYEDLLSVLSIAMSLRQGLSFADRGALRILLSDPYRPSGRVARPARMSAKRLRAHFLRPDGVRLPDPRDLRALCAHPAITSGAILVRVMDPARLERKGMHAPESAQVNMAVGEDFAALSTAGFSRRDLMDRAIYIDRISAGRPGFDRRRETAEKFWSAGNPCNREVLSILDGLIFPLDVPAALAAGVSALETYPLFQPEPSGEGQLADELISQSLARVYENGFCDLRLPAGTQAIQVEKTIQRRLTHNRGRMIGPRDPGWFVRVEMASGIGISDQAMEAILRDKVPLLPDGTIAQHQDESAIASVFRRVACQARHSQTSERVGHGKPIRVEKLEVELTKAQQGAADTLISALQEALAKALDPQSAALLRDLASIAEISCEAALTAWKQGGMSVRVATRAGERHGKPQNVLPMFAEAQAAPIEREDIVGSALQARTCKAIDRARLDALLARRETPDGTILVFAEEPAVRHALARLAVQKGKADCLAVIAESELRDIGVSGRDVAYARAHSAEAAMVLLEDEAARPDLIFADCDQATRLSLPWIHEAVVFSAPEETERLTAALAAIDGPDKPAGGLRIEVMAPIMETGLTDREGSGLHGRVGLASEMMRAAPERAPDGVADSLADLRGRLGSIHHAPVIPSLNLAMLDTENLFTTFVVAGASEEADTPAMPPRVITVIRDCETGEEMVLRNQAACVDFMARLDWPEPVVDPRVKMKLPDFGCLETIGRHMSHLTHWDARPERLVAPLEALAEFLSQGELTGEDMFSDLCLVSLEIIGAHWRKHIVASYHASPLEAPGLAEAMKAFADRPEWERDGIRLEMMELVDRRIVEDALRPKTLHERVVAILHGNGERDLQP